MSQSSNFRLVAAMNVAFGNPQGDRRRDRLAAHPQAVHEHRRRIRRAARRPRLRRQGRPRGIVSTLKWFASHPVSDPSLDHVRDALCDIHVFGYGAHHLMGIDADADMLAVLQGVMTRFIKDDADKAATIAKHADAGVTDVYFEGNTPPW
jgi:hypothetical protein